MISSELTPGEPHPSAQDAMDYLKKFTLHELMLWNEAFASSAIAGSRLGAICSGTIERIMDRQPVSDRYLLGLVWAMRDGKKDGG